MLVLSRKRQEQIFIGDDIQIVVVDVRGDRVKLGFNAPPEVSIQRAELRERLAREQAAAANNQNASAVSFSRDADLGIWVPTRERV